MQLEQACGPKLANADQIASGIARFAAASLQYDLVTETRDAIGSAAAVALPQEDVIRTRDNAVKAFDEFVRTGSDLKNLTSDVVCGMMFKLLDVQGLSKDRLIDREPFRPLFSELQKLPDKADPKTFLVALDRAFGGEAGKYLRDWHLPLEGQVSRRM
ncbi:MAG: hypothetical protein H5T86_05845 [Armatimonadetes bacterium]|nr:hypothetical protein [Armatimonadota bacterium]